MADSTTGAEYHQRFALLQLEELVQSAQRRQRVAGHDTGLLDAEFFGNRGDVVGFHHGVLRVETAFGIDEGQRVSMVAFLEATDLRADRGNGSGAVGTEDIRESRLGAEYFGELAFAFVWIPDADAGGFDAEEDFIGPAFRH